MLATENGARGPHGKVPRCAVPRVCARRGTFRRGLGEARWRGLRLSRALVRPEARRRQPRAPPDPLLRSGSRCDQLVATGRRLQARLGRAAARRQARRLRSRAGASGAPPVVAARRLSAATRSGAALTAYRPVAGAAAATAVPGVRDHRPRQPGQEHRANEREDPAGSACAGGLQGVIRFVNESCSRTSPRESGQRDRMVRESRAFDYAPTGAATTRGVGVRSASQQRRCGARGANQEREHT